jgi:hypothetical protein
MTGPRPATPRWVVPLLAALFLAAHLFQTFHVENPSRLSDDEESWRASVAHGLLTGVIDPGNWTDHEGGALLASLFLAPFFYVGGFSFLTLKVAALALTALGYAAYVAVAFRALPRRAAWLACVLQFVPYPHFYWNSLYLLGNFSHITLFNSIVFLALFPLLEERRPRVRAVAVFAVVVGTGILYSYGVAYAAALGVWLVWINRRSYRGLTPASALLRVALVPAIVVLLVVVLPRTLLNLELTTHRLDQMFFSNPLSFDYLRTAWNRFREAATVILPMTFEGKPGDAIDAVASRAAVLGAAAAFVAWAWIERTKAAQWIAATARAPKGPTHAAFLVSPADLPLIAVLYCAGVVFLYSFSTLDVGTPLTYLVQLQPLVFLFVAALPGKLPAGRRAIGYVPYVLVLSASLLGNLHALTWKSNFAGLRSMPHRTNYPFRIGATFGAKRTGLDEALNLCDAFAIPTDRDRCREGAQRG